MIERRAFESLGYAHHGWLEARHHFSFADYVDRQRMHWGALRVWNDDAIAPGAGFPPHPHANMEIITYVTEGAITHTDSLGNQGRTVAGDVQVMSAGTGIRHSEYNRESITTRLFQIWIQTDQPGAAPAWGTQPFPVGDRAGRWVVVASGDPADREALRIGAQARVLAATLRAGESLLYSDIDPSRRVYLVAAKGQVQLHGVTLFTRDGAAISGERELRITADQDAELVMVDARA